MRAAGARARGRQAGPRDQDRRHAKIALRRAVAYRRHRRRLRRVSGDVRALRHRQLPLARRSSGNGAGLPMRAAAEGSAHRLRHHLRRHGRSAVRLCRNRRRGDSGIFRRHQRGADAVHAGRHHAEESARYRHSDDPQGRRRPTARSSRAIRASTWSPGRRRCRAKAAAGTTCTNFSRAAGATDKPVIAFGRMIHQMTQDGLDVQEKAGFPFLQGQQPTLRALNALWFFGERAGRTPPALPPAPASDLTPANLEATLARYGIALPQSRAVADAQQAAEAAAAHRISGGAENPLRRHRAQDRSRRRHARSAQPRTGASTPPSALAKAARAAHPRRQDRRLSGAGNGVGRRGDRRRSYRPALRPAAARRLWRHHGRVGARRGAAAAAGRARATSPP